MQTDCASLDEALTGTERAVATLWNEVLQSSSDYCASDDFFAVGGDSMSMIILEFRLKEELCVELPAGSVLAAPTLRELSTLIDASREKAQPPCAGAAAS